MGIREVKAQPEGRNLKAGLMRQEQTLCNLQSPASSLQPLLLAFGVLCAIRPATCGEPVLKEKKVRAPAGQDIVLVTYRGEDFRRVMPEDLDRPENWRGQHVCVEGKFSEVAGTQTLAGEDHQVLLLAGSAVQMLYPTRLGPLGLIRGDNIWIGGIVEAGPAASAVRIRVRGVHKLANDSELFEERYARYDAANDWRELLSLGDWMAKASDTAVGLMEVDDYRRRQKKAYHRGLAVWSATSNQNDAEEQYRIAKKYLDLLNDTLNAQRHLLRCVAVDPAHKAATAYLQRFGYLYSETHGAWVTRKELERLGQAQPAGTPTTGTTTTPAATTGTGDTGQPALTPQERQARIAGIVRRCLGGESPEIDVLLDAAGQVDDAGVAVFLIASLRMRPEEKALTGLKKAAAVKDAEVTLTALESLLFRPEPAAHDDFLALAAAIKDKELACSAVTLLEGKADGLALPLLVEMLARGEPAVAEAAEAQLTARTGERFAGRDEWRAWWEKNRRGYE